MTITRRDWWAGIAVVTAALLLNSAQGLYSISWTYWLTHWVDPVAQRLHEAGRRYCCVATSWCRCSRPNAN